MPPHPNLQHQINPNSKETGLRGGEGLQLKDAFQKKPLTVNCEGFAKKANN